jgi:hypothetical protein
MERNYVGIRCEFSLGGFSAERIFRIELPNGKLYTGAAPVYYCYPQEQPSKGKGISKGEKWEGKVAARIVHQENGGKALVSIPDGEVIVVDASQIEALPQEPSPDVLVQS